MNNERLRIDLDPQKLFPPEKKNPQNKTPQKLKPFSQIKNSARMDLLCTVRIGFCFVLLLFSPFVQ